MMKTSDSDTASRSRPPGWLYEGLDLIDQRRRALLITTGVLVIVAVVVAIVAPGLLPPTPLVGAAVGVAALLLSIAVLIALDSADLTVRGPRHVRAAGGELVAVLPSRADTDAASELAAAIQDVRPDGRTLLLGIAAATGDGSRCAAWVGRLGHRLALDGTSVLTLDMTGEGNGQPGFLEMVRKGAKLSSVVKLDPDLRLAHLGAGRDTKEALRAFVEAGSWIPRDLEVLLVALPMAASRPVVRASLVLDQLLVVAERDRTSRVELIAGLDAVEAVGTQAQVILIDDAFARHLGVGAGPSGSPADATLEPDVPQGRGVTVVKGAAADLDPPGDQAAPADPEVTDVDDEPEFEADPVAPAFGSGTQVIEDEATVAVSRSEPHRATVPEPTPIPDPMPQPDPMPEPMPDPLPDPQPDPMPQPEPTPQPDPEPTPQPDPMPDPMSDSDPGPEPDPVPALSPEPDPAPTSRPKPQPRPLEHESTEPIGRKTTDTAGDESSAPSEPQPTPASEARASTADTDRLPRFNPSAAAPEEPAASVAPEPPTAPEAEEQDLLTSTARLSRLMDEVADRESDRPD